jgi:spore germination protein YaaH
MKTLTIIAFAIITMAGASTAHAQTATSSISTSLFGERIFYWSDSKSNITDFTQHSKYIDIIAPQTYEVTTTLTASGTVPIELYNAARANHIKIMPLIANSGFSRTIIHNLLASSTAESALISFLVSEAQTKGYIGWQFDFEAMSVTDRDAFSTLTEQAATALHKSGLILSVAVVAKISDATSSNATSSDSHAKDFYDKWSGAYDYSRLGAATDFVSIMAYDDPDSKGPAASLPFVIDVLNYAKDKIPANKISLGIPLYYYGWSVTPAKRITSGGTYAMLEQRRAAYPHTEGFSSLYDVPWMKYRLGGKNYIIWYENGLSFSMKTALINIYHLRGFSAWVLGSEDPAIWDILDGVY